MNVIFEKKTALPDVQVPRWQEKFASSSGRGVKWAPDSHEVGGPEEDEAYQQAQTTNGGTFRDRGCPLNRTSSISYSNQSAGETPSVYSCHGNRGMTSVAVLSVSLLCMTPPCQRLSLYIKHVRESRFAVRTVPLRLRDHNDALKTTVMPYILTVSSSKRYRSGL